MVDRIAFTFLAQNNFKGLFQRLNGAPMYDILDTLDAMLKEKGFFPNVSTLRRELDAAGIGVLRMEAAMAAVMRKNSGNTSMAQFTADYSRQLATLPDDQRSNISKYLAGQDEVAESAMVGEYLESAKTAMFRTRTLLSRGAFNRLSDWPTGGPIAKIQAEWNENGARNMPPDKVAQIAIAAKGGNCDEFSATAYMELVKMGIKPVHWVKLDGGDHAFVLIGKIPMLYLDEKDLKKYGANWVVCDAWDKAAYVATEIPDRLPSYKSPFKAMVYKSNL